VNAVIAKRLAIASRVISEEEFRARPELVRTLNVAPPVVDGAVRIVEIETRLGRSAPRATKYPSGDRLPTRPAR
jgi:Ser-tRNA(Ala) deacylase AlaX